MDLDFLSKPQAWYIITERSTVHIISPMGCISLHCKQVKDLLFDFRVQQKRGKSLFLFIAKSYKIVCTYTVKATKLFEVINF